LLVLLVAGGSLVLPLLLVVAGYRSAAVRLRLVVVSVVRSGAVLVFVSAEGSRTFARGLCVSRTVWSSVRVSALAST
jgi:hypothetical protein